MKDLDVLHQEMRAAGAWVFAGGLHPRDRDRRAARDGDDADHRRPVRRGQGVPRRLQHHRRRPTWTPRWSGAARSARATSCRSRSGRSTGDGRRLTRPDVGARVFREEYGRAVAVLIRVLGDIDLAEEAVQDAFAAAVQRWPADGLPPSPAGWIITTARNRAIDRLRREATRDDRQAEAALLHAADEPLGGGRRCATTGCA